VKTVFFGTPDIAVPALEALAETTSVLAVVCQPDRPAGRKLQPRAPAVKLAAERLGLPVHQPSRVRTELDDWLRAQAADLGVVMAYGRILPPAVLSAPRLGCVNLHASLLPEYRGAAPIARVLADGRKETGMSLMQMNEGLDTGPVYLRRALTIDEGWNAGDLARELGILAAKMVRDDLDLVTKGVEPEPQDDSLATHAPPIENSETRLSWALSAGELHARVRAFNPIPGAHTFSKGRRLRILETTVTSLESAPERSMPGTIVSASRDVISVATGKGLLGIRRAQLEGKKPLGARELLNGRVVAVGDVLG
jgi:methionyl-tRNA formyltransferase